MASSSSLVGAGFSAASGRIRENTFIRQAQERREAETAEKKRQFNVTAGLQQERLEAQTANQDVNRQLTEAKAAREENALAQEKRVQGINERIIASERAIRNIDEFGEAIKGFKPGIPINEMPAEAQQRLFNSISNLSKDGVGVTITSEGIIPFEKDEEGNPVFLPIPQMAIEHKKLMDMVAGDKQELQTLAGSSGDVVDEVQKIGNDTRIIFKDGTHKDIKGPIRPGKVIHEKREFEPDLFFRAVTQPDGSLVMEEVPIKNMTIEDIDDLDKDPVVPKGVVDKLLNFFGLQRQGSGGEIPSRNTSEVLETTKDFFKKRNSQRNLEELDADIKEAAQ